LGEAGFVIVSTMLVGESALFSRRSGVKTFNPALRIPPASHGVSPLPFTRKLRTSTPLESWSMELKQQIGQALANTVRNGDILTERNGIKLFLRNWAL
jgi:hypothetical protein